MNMNELATAVREKLPLVEIIVNNHVLGMVRQWQDLFYQKRYSATVLDDGMDYVKLAEAMGAKGLRATTREEFAAALKEAWRRRCRWSSTVSSTVMIRYGPWWRRVHPSVTVSAERI